jgi:hypothetical protein
VAILFGIGIAAPKHSVKEVMKLAHGKEGLLGKVTGGKASDEEKKQLVALYKDMCEGQPKKGDAAAWKEKCVACVKAAEEVAEGKDSIAKLKTATNCAGCHKEHK